VHTQHRIDIHIHWFGGLRDQLGRMNIDTLRSWLTPVLAAVAVGLLALIYLSGRTLAPVPSPAPVPVPGKVDPKPAVDPDPAPDPQPATQPEAAASPLTKAAQEYVRTLPRAFQDLADKVESGELKTKADAVAFSKKHAAAMAAAMDQVFSGGVDQSGKITDPGAISAPLKATARALGAGRVRTSGRTTEGF
jgi:hypothetical protein